jgi:hypothetical protein
MPRVEGGVSITSTTPLDPRAHTYMPMSPSHTLPVYTVIIEGSMPRVEGGVSITSTTPLDPRAHTYMPMSPSHT